MCYTTIFIINGNSKNTSLETSYKTNGKAAFWGFMHALQNELGNMRESTAEQPLSF